MRAWREHLSALGRVVAFDYSYMRVGRKTPDRLPALIAAHAAALADARASHAGPVHLVGKSMGGRIGCHLSLEAPVTSLICLGYPLVAASNGAVRDEILLALRTPILFVQGTRDPLCPLDRLEGVLARMTAPHQLLVVEGGNHSLELPGGKAARAAQEASDAAVLEAVRAFVEPRETREARD
jgi:predicted alpha/beta-hydrolase family hydrolase